MNLIYTVYKVDRYVETYTVRACSEAEAAAIIANTTEHGYRCEYEVEIEECNYFNGMTDVELEEDGVILNGANAELKLPRRITTSDDAWVY